MNQHPRRSLEQLTISEPCHQSWSAMSPGDGGSVGNAGRRFCESCSKHVHDLSALSREEGERLVNDSAGSAASSVCIRMTRDASGNVVTRDAPGSVTRRGWLRRMTAVAALLGVGSLFQFGCTKTEPAPNMGTPLPPEPHLARTMGIVALPPRAPGYSLGEIEPAQPSPNRPTTQPKGEEMGRIAPAASPATTPASQPTSQPAVNEGDTDSILLPTD